MSYNWETGFACTWCDAWHSGEGKRMRKAKRKLVHRHCTVDGGLALHYV